MLSDKTRDGGHKLKFGKFRKKKLLTVRMAEHWDRLPRDVVKSPSLEITKTQTDTARNNLL